MAQLNAIRKIFRIYPRLRSVFYIRWNRMWFYLIGIKYGKCMRIYDKIYVTGLGLIEIGDDFVFTSGGGINPLSRNLNGSLHTMTSKSIIHIGDRVHISSASIWANNRITIGNDVNIGSDCLIIDNDAHPHNYNMRHIDFVEKVGWEKYLEEVPTAPVEICDDVWIGARCQILKGVKIGSQSIIAAGSIVTKNIPSGVVAGGNPCRVIKELHN